MPVKKLIWNSLRKGRGKLEKMWNKKVLRKVWIGKAWENAEKEHLSDFYVSFKDNICIFVSLIYSSTPVLFCPLHCAILGAVSYFHPPRTSHVFASFWRNKNLPIKRILWTLKWVIIKKCIIRDFVACSRTSLCWDSIIQNGHNLCHQF